MSKSASRQGGRRATVFANMFFLLPAGTGWEKKGEGCVHGSRPNKSYEICQMPASLGPFIQRPLPLLGAVLGRPDRYWNTLTLIKHCPIWTSRI